MSFSDLFKIKSFKKDIEELKEKLQNQKNINVYIKKSVEEKNRLIQSLENSKRNMDINIDKKNKNINELTLFNKKLKNRFDHLNKEYNNIRIENNTFMQDDKCSVIRKQRVHTNSLELENKNLKSKQEKLKNVINEQQVSVNDSKRKYLEIKDVKKHFNDILKKHDDYLLSIDFKDRKSFFTQLQNEFHMQDLRKEFEDLIETINNKMSIKQLDADKLQNYINECNKDIDYKENAIREMDEQLSVDDFGITNPKYKLMGSEECNKSIKMVRATQKRLDSTEKIDDERLLLKLNPYEMVNIVEKLLKKCFKMQCHKVITKVTMYNYEKSKERLLRLFEANNNISKSSGVKLLKKSLEYKYDELDLQLQYKIKKEQEKEKIKEENRRKSELKAKNQEIENEKKKVNKDINHYKNALDKLELRLQKEQNEDLKNKIIQLKKEIKDKKKERDDLESNLYNPKAGYVYIISNIGSFGKNVFKIGVTRRINPDIRIKELNSASVPFIFDKHAIIFSEDAFSLEKKLHMAFDDRKINKVNNHKEFYNVSIDDIEKELIKYNDETIEFKRNPDAIDYNETLKLEKNH